MQSIPALFLKSNVGVHKVAIQSELGFKTGSFATILLMITEKVKYLVMTNSITVIQ